MRFVDVEAVVADFFRAESQVDIFTKLPKQRPAEFVQVTRTGGAAVNRVLDRPIVTVTGWAADKGRAAELLGVFRDLLQHRSSEIPLVRGVEEATGPYYDPDPESGVPRYSVSFRMRVRATR